MPGSRHLSQRISEGDGIAIIAQVEDVGSARAAQQQGAKAIAVSRTIDGIRDATTLPLLWLGRDTPHDADACAVRHDHEPAVPGCEAVAEVRDAEQLEEALDRFDPEIFLLATDPDDDEADPLDAVLELLADVPAGKLAIAHLDISSRDEVLALERAGMDAVLVPGASVQGLVGHAPVDV